MKNNTKIFDIETVLNRDNTVIGYIIKNHKLYGFCLEIPDGWTVTPSLLSPSWFGNFSKRKKAIKHLEQLYLKQLK